MLTFDMAIEIIDINTVHHSTNLASELDDTSFTRSAGLRWGRQTIVDILSVLVGILIIPL